jgi:2-oxoglutarate ferredoxin oxidoreductase subunit alpha
MTSTSGGGFSLMVEGLGLAGITETPVVIVNAQRPGPATGLPTRTEQADLLFVINAAQGEFPRAVLTPGTAGQAFIAMTRAFNLAEKYQTPVIVLADQYITDSIWTEKPFDISSVSIDRGKLFTQRGDARRYKRYALENDGISPRAFPGNVNALVYADSDEHDESGRITESAEVRNSQAEKRMRKLQGLASESVSPVLYGPKDYRELLVCWGSTLCAAIPAMEILNENGSSLAVLHIEQAWPLPGSEISRAMRKAGKTFCVEMNSMGQMAKLIRSETGLGFDRTILKYDGRPFLQDELSEEIGKEGANG